MCRTAVCRTAVCRTAWCRRRWCTRGAGGGWCTPGIPGSGTTPWVHHPTYPRRLAPTWTTEGPRLGREDTLGSEVSCSLGKVSLARYPAQSCLSSSKILPGLLARAYGRIGRCLDSARAIWPLINLGAEGGGESLIPLPPSRARQESTEETRNPSFLHFARDTRVTRLRITLCDTFADFPRVE